MKRIIISILSVLLPFIGLVGNAQIKVACVGDSVTYGMGVEGRDSCSYPSQLQRLLGKEFDVRNFGKSGATLLNKGHRPYIEQQEYKDAVAFKPDWVIIHLGLNDTDPRNWPNFRDEFLPNYMALIDTFRTLNPSCKVWICRMTPIFHQHSRFKAGTRDWFWQMQDEIVKVSQAAGTGLISLHEGLYQRPDLLPDALHPNAEGAGIIANTVYGAITGNYGGLKMADVYTDNMVLQREKPLTINGTANAGEKVQVTIASQKHTAVANATGQWQITLAPLKAGGPYTLAISTKTKKLTYKNILAGEVWVCSGQSNMAWRVNQCKEHKELAAWAATQPQVRIFDMKPKRETNSTTWDAEALKAVNQLDYYTTKGWQECNATTAEQTSAIAFAYAKMLKDSLNVPVGIIVNAIGGSPTEAWIDRYTLEHEMTDILYNWTKNSMIQPWVRERGAQNIGANAKPLQRHPFEPCYLFESGIKPLANFPIKGIIWYQGESNANNVELHEQLFNLLAKSWRSYWNEELPIYFVQLSGHNRPSWPHFRDSQRRLAQSIPNTGMAVCSDRGDSLDVHPRAKKEVGERLARLALNNTYGKQVTPSGPAYQCMDIVKGAAYVYFDHAMGMTTSDGKPLRGFEVADENGCFMPAQVEIEDNRIKVWNTQIKNPSRVRYAWQPYTRANLVNSEGLPASTFSTEY
ncbi:MAG: GDSL-type esterase/lipase family protein [Marinifilaceae bacterium]